MDRLTLTRLLPGNLGCRVTLGLIEHELKSQRRYVHLSVAAIINPFDHVGMIKSRLFSNKRLFQAYFDFLEKRIEKFMNADEVLDVVGIPDRHQALLGPLLENYKKSQGVLTTCANFWFKNAAIDVAPTDADGDPMEYEFDEIDDVALFDWLNRVETVQAKQGLENACTHFDQTTAEFIAAVRKLI